ncbi:MAG TPA: hypothetical protein VG733_13775, partial [Chthoniobacteraceae bacterium]|nr:hypothetical protein [Chthoniobacteraceae bacterium]
YTSFHASLARNSWNAFLQSLAEPGGFAVFVALDVLFVLFVAGALVRQFLVQPERRMSPALFAMLVFSACVIDCNWGAVLLTGDFTDLFAARYVRMAMLLPAFHALAYVNHVIRWSRAGTAATVAALSIAIGCFALFFRPIPSPSYRQTQMLLPVIRSIMEKEHIEAGLADYWYANPITFFSGGKASVRAVLADGSIFQWVNSTEWYAGEGPPHPPPEFRLILMANLNPDLIRQRYGDAKAVHTPMGADLWIYPPEKSIKYNPIFWTLSNGPLNEYSCSAGLLPSKTGQLEGRSRVARAGRDPAEILTWGPFPYLRPQAGRYRISISYTYFTAPNPDMPIGWEVTRLSKPSPQVLDHAPIAFIDTARHEFTREITIPDDKRLPLQVNTRYNNSGDFGIDSLKIIYLGK